MALQGRTDKAVLSVKTPIARAPSHVWCLVNATLLGALLAPKTSEPATTWIPTSWIYTVLAGVMLVMGSALTSDIDSVS